MTAEVQLFLACVVSLWNRKNFRLPYGNLCLFPQIRPPRKGMMAPVLERFILLSVLLVGHALGEISLNDDPSSWPGHLKPLGTGRPMNKVAEVEGFPEPDGKWPTVSQFAKHNFFTVENA